MNEVRARLLYVVNDPAFFLSHRVNIALAARAQGLQVSIAAPRTAGHREISDLGFGFHPISLHRWGANPFNEVRTLYALYTLYRRVRPDIVHHITIKPVLYGSFTARAAQVPAIVNAISGMGQVFSARGLLGLVRRRLVETLYRWAFKHPRSKVIFQNPDDHAYFIKRDMVTPEQAAIVHGAGVDIERYRQTSEPVGPLIIVFPARLLVEKGIREMVQAARILRAQGVQVEVLIAGDRVEGNPGSISAQELRGWEAEGVCRFLGYCKDMPALLESSHIVCLPSYYKEGVPKALIEGAACARPLVTTDWPGCREIVHHEDNGLLVPIKDPQALASALRRLIDDPALRARMGARGREMVIKGAFSNEAVVGETLAIYHQLLTRTRAASK